MSEWQTIESAPKDGTAIDVWASYGERHASVSWREGDWLTDHGTKDDLRAAADLLRPIGWRTKEGRVLPASYLTHWMPEPSPPPRADVQEIRQRLVEARTGANPPAPSSPA